MDANHDEVDRSQQVGHGVEVQAVKGDEQPDDGVQHAADAQAVHEGEESLVGFPLNGLVIVHYIVFDGKQGEDDSLHRQRQPGDALSLFIGANLGLSHQVDNAEGEENRHRNHAVWPSILEGRASQEYQSDNGTHSEEHGIARYKAQRRQLGSEGSRVIGQFDFFVRGRWCAEKDALGMHDRHHTTGQSGDEAAPSPFVSFTEWLEGVA